MADIYEKLASGYYNDPKPPEKPKRDCVECGTSLREVTKFCPHCGEAFKDPYEAKVEAYNKEREAYRKKCEKLSAEFKADALAHCELTSHKNADKAFAKAWESDHSNGLEAVLNELSDLSDLMV